MNPSARKCLCRATLHWIFCLKKTSLYTIKSTIKMIWYHSDLAIKSSKPWHSVRGSFLFICPDVAWRWNRRTLLVCCTFCFLWEHFFFFFFFHKRLLYSWRRDESTEDDSAPAPFCRVSKFKTHLYERGMSLILAFLYKICSWINKSHIYSTLQLIWQTYCFLFYKPDLLVN